MEVVIALGPSTDRTDEIAAELVARGPRRVHTVPNPTGRTPAALNAAIKASRHPIVVRVDGHGMLSPGLHRHRRTAPGGDRRAERRRHHARRGRERLGARRRRRHDLEDRRGQRGLPHRRRGPARRRPSTSGVFRREALEQQGGYNEEFIRAQDWELNFRIREAGGLIWFSPELRVSVPPAAEREGARQAVQGLRPLAARRRPLPRGLHQPALPRPADRGLRDRGGHRRRRRCHPVGLRRPRPATSRRSPRARCPRARGCR